MLSIFSTVVLFRHLWQLKTVDFLKLVSNVCCSIKSRWKKVGNTGRGGRFSTVDLLIKVPCLVKRENIFDIKRNWSKLVSARRSTVLSLPFSKTSLLMVIVTYWAGTGDLVKDLPTFNAIKRLSIMTLSMTTLSLQHSA